MGLIAFINDNVKAPADDGTVVVLLIKHRSVLPPQFIRDLLRQKIVVCDYQDYRNLSGADISELYCYNVSPISSAFKFLCTRMRRSSKEKPLKILLYSQ